MAEKFFLVNPKIENQSKEIIQKIADDRILISSNAWEDREKKAEEAMHEECKLKHVDGRVIIRANAESKNSHTFQNGITIRRERNFNEFNRRVTQPTNAIVVSAENIPKDSEILIAHNALHDTNRIFDYGTSSNDVHYYSIKEEDCFAWKDKDGEYKPMPNYEFGLRVFEPYKGRLVGIQPKILNDIIYCTTGDLKGNVLYLLKAAIYEIIFQGANGQEQRILRFRHSNNPEFEREEVIGVADALTAKADNGELLIGLNANEVRIIL